MKIVQVIGGRAHWVTPHKSPGELYVDVRQAGGGTERQRRYPETDEFVEAPDDVEEGWVYLGGGKFRPDEPERLRAEIDALDAEMRALHEQYQLDRWVESLANAPGTKMPGGGRPDDDGCPVCARARRCAGKKGELLGKLEKLKCHNKGGG